MEIDPKLFKRAVIAGRILRVAGTAIDPRDDDDDGAHPRHLACCLVIARRIAKEIDAGRYADQADVARHPGLTRVRLIQLMNLLPLAQDIQEEVLALEYPADREPITERTLRRLFESLVFGTRGRCG